MTNIVTELESDATEIDDTDFNTLYPDLAGFQIDRIIIFKTTIFLFFKLAQNFPHINFSL